MDQDTNKLIDEQLKTLPEPLQRAIVLSPWQTRVQEIARANNLSEPSAESLETETMFVIYRFENQEDFVSNIMRELSLDIAKATMIAGEVDKNVFSPILVRASELKDQKGEETHIIEKEPNVPMIIEREKPMSFEERKKLVPNINSSPNKYEGGKDPYREPI